MGNCCSKPDDEDAHVDPRTPLLSSTIKTIADSNDLSASSKRISRRLGFFKSTTSARNLAVEAASKSSKFSTQIPSSSASLSSTSFPRPPSIPPVPEFDVNNPLHSGNNNNIYNSSEKPKLRQSEELKKRLSTISISNNNDSGVPTPPSTSQQLIKFYNEKDKEEKERIAREENEKERLRQMEAAIEKEKEKERVKSTEKEKDKEQGKEKEREKYNSNLSKILTSKNSDITPQERVSQTVQTLLEVCREIGEIIANSNASTDLTVETTMKKRVDILTLQASKNTVQLCEVVDTLTQSEFTSKSHLNTLKRSESKRGKWEFGIRENTRKASSKIEQLMIECRNANVEQRKMNVKMYEEKIEELLEKIRSEATQLVELVLAQWEVSQSAESIVEASNKHQSISGIETVLRAAKVAVSVVHRLIDSLSDINVGATEGPAELVKVISNFFGPGQDSKDTDQALFFANALHVCALQLFDAVDTIAQAHFDPGVQLELWNKAKAVRGSGILLQIAITEKDRVLSDRCLSLSAASRVFASSVVNLIDSSASAVTMEPPKNERRYEESSKASVNQLDLANVWIDEENLSSIMIFDATTDTVVSTPPTTPVLSSQVPHHQNTGNSGSISESTESIKNEQEPQENSEIKDDNTQPTTNENTTVNNTQSTTEILPSDSGEIDIKNISSASSSTSSVSSSTDPTLTPRSRAPSGNVLSQSSGSAKKLKAATLNGLLLYLIFDRIDIQYMETISLTYRSFSDSYSFFLKLVELYPNTVSKNHVNFCDNGRYNVPEYKGDQKIVIQSRVATFIKKWITSHLQDFSYDLVHAITKWTENILQKDNHTKGLARQILDLLTVRDSEQSAMRLSVQEAVENKVQKDVSPNRFALDMDAHEIALQLTWIDQQAFSAIRPHELLFQSWNKPHLRHRAPNVLSMISRTNNIALWVASSILWHPKLTDRAQVMTKLILVAEHLRKLNNFNTMYAVLSGLQLSSVNRLKYTKERVPKRQIQTFDSLVELMSPTKSFKIYRDALVSTIPPCIPYLGLCLTDLTFIEEGNPDFITPAEGKLKLINFKKREKLFKVISDIQQYQSWKYQALQGYTNSILEELPRNEEEQLYGMSLLREPRNASKEQIV